VATILVPFKPPDEAVHPGSSEQSPAACKPEVMTVTPAIAQDWADRNTRNRPVRYNKVSAMARDMAAGKWQLNGQTIKITTDGTIIDGQHRIYACISAGVSFETVVIFGLPPEVQDTIDTGTARTMSDQLNLRGEPHASVLASTARWAFKWLRGSRGSVRGDTDPTHSEIDALLQAEPRIREAAAWADYARKQFRSVQGSVYGMAWLIFHGNDHLAAEVFLAKVVTGADCPEDHPALAFRNRVLRARDEGQRLTPHEQLALFVSAWNAFKEERTMKTVQLPKGGLTPKNFPEPR
jgi:hypothetical protein